MRTQGKGSVQRDQSRILVSKEEYDRNFYLVFNREDRPACIMCDTLLGVKFYPWNKEEESYGGEWFCDECASGTKR